MRLTYHPTAHGPAEVLDTDDSASVERARAHVRGLRFEIVSAGFDCSGCGRPVARGAIVLLRQKHPEHPALVARCQPCAAEELLPLHDALRRARLPAAA